MNENLSFLIVMITGMMTFGWVATSWIRARHGCASRRDARGEELEANRQIQLLSSENAGLKGQLGRLEERLSVLERIATDPAERTLRQIEALRVSGN